MTQVLGCSNISVYISDPFGVRLGDASNFVSLKYPRVVNNWSTLELVLPNSFDQTLLRIPDGRIEVWRRIPGSTREVLDTEAVWLIKAPEWERDDRGNETLTIEADHPLCILKEPGRFVNYDSSSETNADFTSQPYDDAIKTIAQQNIGASDSSLSTQSRNLSAYISIAPNLSQAPIGSKSFSWRACLKTMQEIANASAQASTYLAFDIVAPTPATLEFRTYTQQRGVDHRFPNGINPIIIGPEFGNMGACTLREDWRNEITYALAGGKGEGSARLTAESYDSARIGASPFGLREQFVDATQYSTTTGLAAEAAAVVRNGRPRAIFKGKLLDTPDTRYGVHWGWGDFVTVQAFGQSFDCRIDAITVTVANGKETIDAWLRNDGLI